MKRVTTRQIVWRSFTQDKDGLLTFNFNQSRFHYTTSTRANAIGQCLALFYDSRDLYC